MTEATSLASPLPAVTPHRAITAGLDGALTRFAATLPVWQPETLQLGAQAFDALSGPNLFAGVLATHEALVRIDTLMPAARWQASIADAWAVPFQTQLETLASTSRALDQIAQGVRQVAFSQSIEVLVSTAMASWASAVRSIDILPDPSRVLPLSAFGAGTYGFIEAAALIDDVDEVEGAPDREGLLSPSAFANELRERLRRLDDRLPARLDGAWERVSRAGPDAASQAAHSIMETIDWALRLAATDDEVLGWHSSTGRAHDELHNDKPTRSLRVRYLLRERPEEAKAAAMQIRVLKSLVEITQEAKHSQEGTTVDAVTRLIPTVEGFLIFVLP